jgi:hypothetical protein
VVPLRRVAVATIAAVIAAASLTGCTVRREGPPEDTATATEVTADPADDEAAIRDTFEAYRTALLELDGDAVVDLVTYESIGYYGELADLAGTAGPEEIGERAILERTTVALLRVEYPVAELAAYDGAEMLAFSVDEGLVDNGSVVDNELGDVRIVGDQAYAELVVRSVPSGVDFEFKRLGGEWLFNLIPTIRLGNLAVTQAARESGLDENEFIFDLVEVETGVRVDATIFDRPR